MITNSMLVIKDPEKSSTDFVKHQKADELKGLKAATINDERQQFLTCVRQSLINIMFSCAASSQMLALE